MSVYIVEEPNEMPIFITDNAEVEDCTRLTSLKQKKRFSRVLRQIKETWVSIFDSLNMLIEHGIEREQINHLLKSIYKLFFIEHKNRINYYSKYNVYNRQKDNYLQKKIKSIKNKKYEL